MAKAKKGLNWAIVISVISLFVSVLTATLTLFYHHDEVRLVIGSSLEVLRDKNEFTLSEQQTFTFINSGNRQALVSDIYGLFVIAIDAGDAESQCKREHRFHKSIWIDAAPVVLKPGDIQVIRGKVVEQYPWKKIGDRMRFREDGKVEGAARYVVCLEAYITTPDNSLVRWVQALYDLPGPDKNSDDPLFDTHTPITVLQRTYLGL